MKIWSVCCDRWREAVAESGSIADWTQYTCFPDNRLHLLREPSAANDRQSVPLSISLMVRTAAVEVHTQSPVITSPRHSLITC